MASRKEERERLRQVRLEKEREQQQSQKRRLYLGYGIAGVLVLAIVAGIVVVATGGSGPGGNAHISQASGSTNDVSTDDREGVGPPAAQVTNLERAAEQAGCDLRLRLRNEGATHVPSGTEVEYRTSPPNSGNHVEPPFQQADGAYSETPGQENVIHSLEHGRMAIEYDPSLPEQDQLELKGLYDTMYGAALFFPNDEMDYQVAAVTWTNILGCEEYRGRATLDAIRAFGRRTWGRFGGEPVDAFGPIAGPTPANPQ